MNNHYTFKIKTWIWYNSLGWLLGMILLLGIAILGEALFAEKLRGGQSVIGIGLGTGMGFMQWRYLKKFYNWPITWLWYSMLGFSGMYLFYDLLSIQFELKPEKVLPVVTLLAGAMSGYLQQHYILKGRMKKPKAWILINAFSWFAVHLLTGALFLLQLKENEFLPRAIILTLAFTFILIGGPLIGLFSSYYFTKIQNSTSVSEN